ncbi:MAG: hypothetical protein MI743_11050 [Sneathiellales bacterium]|nr:hypothetical protein [Sneathiellales bacterium]
MGILWENSFGVFFALTVVIAGGAAFMTGRSLAAKWRSPIQPVLAMLLLGAADRFFHFALFEGSLLSVQYYIVDTTVLILIALLGYRLMRVNQMVQQYPWLYARSGPFAWRDK